ncbi:MAG TPA: hypothetical protein VF519_00875 [Mycobacteriales bacterium]|jgi:hypothetical protein
MSHRSLRWARRGLVPLVALSLCAVATPASAQPLPPPPMKVDKYVSAVISVTYVPGAPAAVRTGGDAAWAFACTTTDDGRGNVDVSCAKDAGEAYTLQCSILETTATNPPLLSVSPRLDAYGACGDSSTTYVEPLTHPGPQYQVRLAVTSLRCAASGAAEYAYSVTCAFSSSVRQPITGGVVIDRTSATAPITYSLWGVLATSDWSCVSSVSATPPTVTCTAVSDPTVTQWFCDQTVVSAAAERLVPAAPVEPSRVRGQVSCDGNDEAVATPGTLTTREVPTVPGGLPVDNAGTTLFMDTDTFICQAWGPVAGNVLTPIGPYTVECSEP